MALDFDFPAENERDWDGARTKRSVLMTHSAEWVQSTFSCPFRMGKKKLIAPNRDHPYEGLLAYADGEHWKFIDCIGIGLECQDGTPVSLVHSESTVRLNPWSVTYGYRCAVPGGANLPFTVTYRLHSVGSPEVVTGSVELAFPKGLVIGRHRVTPVIVPVVDVRHMYGDTDISQYAVRKFGRNSDQIVSITAYNRNLLFHFRDGKVERFASPETLLWNYRMGVAERRETVDWAGHPMTAFVGEERTITSFFCFRPGFRRSKKRSIVYFECRLDDGQCGASFDELARLQKDSIRRDESQSRQVRTLFDIPNDPAVRDAVHGRIVGLTKFKTLLRNSQGSNWTPVPHAGAWWFRTPWYRDVFEGILSSLKTLMALPEERETLWEILRFAIASQDPATGLIPNRVPEFRGQPLDYGSADASLLCILTAEGYLRAAWVDELAQDVVTAAATMVDRFVENGRNMQDNPEPGGPPRLQEQTGLLLTTAYHSWIDTHNQCVEHAGHRLQWLPNRFSPAFIRRLWNHLERTGDPSSVFGAPHFFLPEINAQWIRMMQGLRWILDRLLSEKKSNSQDRKAWHDARETVVALLGRAEKNFISVFWNAQAGYLFNAVYEDRSVADGIECEAGITAVVLLGNRVFPLSYLQDVWACAKNTLIVERRLGVAPWARHLETARHSRDSRQDGWCPFGLLVKNEESRTYYDDRQYHGGVIWLRSTHYLVQLLRMIGEEKLARDVLLNVLDHQMNEGAVFYNHELLSPPVGSNPQASPDTSGNPVPVKNPIQFWSQWCDQMVEVLGRSAR